MGTLRPIIRVEILIDLVLAGEFSSQVVPDSQAVGRTRQGRQQAGGANQLIVQACDGSRQIERVPLSGVGDHQPGYAGFVLKDGAVSAKQTVGQVMEV